MNILIDDDYDCDAGDANEIDFVEAVETDCLFADVVDWLDRIAFVAGCVDSDGG